MKKRDIVVLGGKQMLDETAIAYAEVDEILNLLEDDYINKVPENVKRFFKEERDNNYEPKIDVDIPLNEQNLKRETMVLLAILKLNYCCKDEDEKKAFLNELNENEREYNEKYNPDNLFKNKKSNKLEENIEENNDLPIEYEEKNIIYKILEKIKSLFRRSR